MHLPENEYINSANKSIKLIWKMHNIKRNFDKILETIKPFSKGIFGEYGNLKRPGPIPKMSDLEVIALTLTSEYLSIDSENYLFKKLDSCHRRDFPYLIERSQFNKRKKSLFHIIDKLRRWLAEEFMANEQYFIVDSMPVEVAKISREKRSRVCREIFETAPDKGYCASQNMYFYGYKLHGICSARGVFHSFDLTKASVHDNEILPDLKSQLSDCVLLGDKGYIGKDIQLDLFHHAHIRLETPLRRNQKEFHVYPKPFRKTRKRLETLFSQLDDQFMLRRNYAKSFCGFKTRILSKITALTIIQFINYFQLGRNINSLKHAII